MDWIWDNLQLIIVVAGAIAVWLNKQRLAKNGEPADYDEDGIPDNRVPPRAGTRELTPASRDGSDPAQEERRRLIQEEIRRKIAERRGQPVSPQMPSMPRPHAPTFEPGRPVFREEPFEPVRPANPFDVPPPAPPPMPVPAPAREVSAYDDTAALERQRRMAEQLAELEAARRQVRRDAQALAETGAQPQSVTEASAARVKTVTVSPGVRGLAADLRDPKALRRAMVLREVLDAPVALR